jgi:hypothetical protein
MKGINMNFLMILLGAGGLYGLIVLMMWILGKYFPKSLCTHDCEQGRKCTCQENQNDN